MLNWVFVQSIFADRYIHRVMKGITRERVNRNISNYYFLRFNFYQEIWSFVCEKKFCERWTHFRCFIHICIVKIFKIFC